MAVLVGLVLGLLVVTPAHGFCGAYVGTSDETVTNHSSVVVLAQNDEGTVLTMANDYQGAPSEFAMVVPVPAGFRASDVAVTASDVLDKLDTLSGPRVVKYDCTTAVTGNTERDKDQYQEQKSSGCGGGKRSESAPDDRSEGPPQSGGELGEVVVQSYAAVGEYEVSIVSASEGEGLQSWLDVHGFSVSPKSSEVLGEYIEEGSWFLVAQVEGGSEGAWLAPLRLTFRDPIFTLPLRLGATSSEGVQDLILYVLGTPGQGHASISNYPEVPIEDECMPLGEEWYDELVDRALAPDSSLVAGEASWALEFGWVLELGTSTPAHCDPCIPPDIDPLGLSELGWTSDLEEAYLSRLRVRYGAGQIDEDLHLYFSYDPRTSQLRYIEYDRHLENLFPICVDGWADEPGFCGEVRFVEPSVGLDENGALDVKGGCTCSALPVGVGVWALVLIVGAVRRRR